MRWTILLAAGMTLFNAPKPVVVDDTAYLAMARHLATNPTRPYDFSLFWYNHPQPAREILLPPVLPYWLALGIGIFGEDLLLLKLWLFPFAFLLLAAIRFLLARFAPSAPPVTLAVFAFGSGLLPFFNFMLDLPSIALDLASFDCTRGVSQLGSRQSLSLWRVSLSPARSHGSGRPGNASGKAR